MKRKTLHWLALSGIISFMAFGSTTTSAPSGDFSYEDWNHVLETFVDDDGLVDYAGLAADRVEFDRLVAQIETVGPTARPELFPTREHQLTYYINAYNAHVFRGVLGLSPDATTVWGFTRSGYGFFVRMKIRVDGRKTNLKALEDDLIRDGFKDPRIHAALNCASIGCPRLPRQAFDPERLDDQLEAEMERFVNEERNCRVDREAGTVVLSKIFDWFRGDFEAYEAENGGADLRDYINRFRASDEQIPAELEIEFAAYDKTLNRR